MKAHPLPTGSALVADGPPGKKEAAPAKEAAGSGEQVTHATRRAEIQSELPRFVRDLLASVPQAGEGELHRWLFRLARVLHPYRTEREIETTLRAAVEGCGRPMKPGEIEDAIRNSKACAWQPGKPQTALPARVPAWPVVNGEQREAIIANDVALYDLWEASPVRFDDAEPHAERIVDTLFPGNPWLCTGATDHDFKTRHRDELCGELSALALIVPSPMIAQSGQTKKGRVSEHTLDATGARRFLVVEFDTGTAHDHAALLLHLAARAPLALAVHSGNKSLHGWFYCAGQDEKITRRFMRYAVSLGADPATWTRSQFVRMPDGTRDTGRRQTVYFFNPASMEGTR